MSKDTAGVIAPPPLIYALGIGLSVLLHAVVPFELLPEWGRGMGIILVVLACIPGPAAIVQMLRARTSPEPWHPTTALLTDGVFRFTRNPIYLSFSLFMIGLALFLQNEWMLAALIPVLIVLHYGVILREERYLSRKFPAYTEYMLRVRRWF